MGKSKKKKKQRKGQKKKEEAALSLASRLKRCRGTADSTPLPPEWSQQSNFPLKQTCLTPQDDAFESCRNECYRGFYWEAPESLPSSLHSKFDEAFDALYHAGLFLYDAVQPGRKRLSKTFVTRTLIGKPGSTYRYLGLRLFSHPWTSDGGDGDNIQSLVALGYTPDCAVALVAMDELNTLLIHRTQHTLNKEIAPHVPEGLVGSADYTLTLVNRMEPTTLKKDLKQEKVYGLGKTSVSWHKDSGLMDFSSIAVYHSLRDTTTAASNAPWKVALRVADKDTKTPPLAVPLPSGALYYLLDDFNHKHEHAVLAGSNQLRYSSTHRVAREGCGTWQYIRDKCRGMLATKDTSTASTLSECRKQLIKETRALQQLLTEIEFEWLRQWYIQGREHARLHPYWHEPIKKLEGWFQEIEQRCIDTISQLEDNQSTSLASEDLFDVLIEAMQDRSKLRATWHERVKDPIFDSMPENTRPFSSPVLDRMTHDNATQLPEDLDTLVSNLRKLRKRFVKQNKRASTTSNNHLTKKEKRKVASNWESMKASMSNKKRK